MPVGNSDRGVGLGAGEVMVFADLNYQNFNWWHEKIDAYVPGTNELEDFEHPGQFNNRSLNLGFTIGLNDYWNITVSQLISERCMDWEGPVFTGDETLDADGFDFDPNIHTIGESKSVHHRSECSSSDFYNGDDQIAFGGYLGDTRINVKYLLYNQGKGPGSRVFLGGGLLIPSSATLTESPWTKTDHDHDHNTSTPDVYTYTPHRHFYLSDGAYKMNLELQFFKKRMKYPVFWGGTLAVNFPLNDSEYGFTPSKRYQLTLLAMSSSRPFQKFKIGNLSVSSVGMTLNIGYAGRSKWKNQGETPNSKSIMYVPGLNVLFSLKNGGGMGLTLTRGFEHYFNENPNDIKERNDIYSISLSYRLVLDKVIEKLYWK